MLVKGKISAIYRDENMLSVILPEFDNAVTDPLPIYGKTTKASDYAVNEFVMVAVFNNDFRDAMVLSKTASGGSADGDADMEAIMKLLEGKSDSDHIHDDRYFTETEWNEQKTLTNMEIESLINSIAL